MHQLLPISALNSPHMPNVGIVTEKLRPTSAILGNEPQLSFYIRGHSGTRGKSFLSSLSHSLIPSNSLKFLLFLWNPVDMSIRRSQQIPATGLPFLISGQTKDAKTAPQRNILGRSTPHHFTSDSNRPWQFRSDFGGNSSYKQNHPTASIFLGDFRKSHTKQQNQTKHRTNRDKLK